MQPIHFPKRPQEPITRGENILRAEESLHGNQGLLLRLWLLLLLLLMLLVIIPRESK